jgi:hypothetical protein
MELHDVIVECAKYSALDSLERPREEASYQGLPPTLWPRYSNIGKFFILYTFMHGPRSPSYIGGASVLLPEVCM